MFIRMRISSIIIANAKRVLEGIKTSFKPISTMDWGADSPTSAYCGVLALFQQHLACDHCQTGSGLDGSQV